MKKKKILIGLGFATSVLPFVASSCGSGTSKNNPNKKPEANKTEISNNNLNNISEDEFKKIVNSINENDLDFKFDGSFLNNIPKHKLIATDFSEYETSISAVLKNKDYKDKINVRFVKAVITSEFVSNSKGELEVVVEVSNKERKELVRIKVTGLEQRPYGAKRNGSIPTDPSASVRPTGSQESDYVYNYDQKQRYDLDNKTYIEALKKQPQYQNLDPNGKIRNDLEELSAEQIKKFDEEAKKAGFSDYVSAALKGFTLPTYKSDGSYDGLSLNEGAEVVKGPSWIDGFKRPNQFKLKGLARTLPNEMYKKAALQTFQIKITNQDSTTKQFDSESGTTWIMDFEKRNDGKYPTKFYFGTNLHVADALKSNTTGVSMLRLNPSAGIKTTFKLSELDEKVFTRFTFSEIKTTNKKESEPITGIKTVFNGRDFLNSKPSDFLKDSQKSQFSNHEEFIDFAVFEIDFKELYDKGFNKDASIAEELAKLVTNGYADNKNDHISFLKKSYLSDYSKINVPLGLKNGETLSILDPYDQLFIVGYPTSFNEAYLKKYVDDHQRDVSLYNYSLWINSRSEYYDSLISQEGAQPQFSEERLKLGEFLSYQIGYRTFTDKPGLVDSFISAPKSGNSFYKSADNKTYINAGLSYLPKYYAPAGGASGSSVRNQRNELIAVYYVSNDSANTGLAAAFRSEGYDYKGLFGTGNNKYYLPQYDLIYGTGKDQKKSYFSALKELYKNNSNFKTNLFQNGVDSDDKIPSEYKFTN
ncbi:variable surface lipoprotein [Mycoplasmopsis caviae]|uniref:Variable surface lipoprotein n=1 Tax=Mycoplasmopsis caviae TaxID=55603 RepID=A0ABY5IZ87_9BACT|nr:variable surface lipoprotein [Mycoplasmopsis caviae]UUD35111.1 variable surface lipoprotein [Mycoplasmopsis caviae]